MTDTTRAAVERLAAWHDNEAGAWASDGGNVALARIHREHAATLRALVAEREEDQGVIAVWRRRAEQAEAERDVAVNHVRATMAMIKARGTNRDYWEATAQKAMQERDAALARMERLTVECEQDMMRAEAERDAARAECERLRLGGCARGQITTQWCAEAVEMMAQRDAARRAARAFGAETAKAHENSKRWRSERDTWQRIAMDAAQRLMLAETERDAARGDVALLQDAWATLHNALNCIIHEEDNDPPDVQNAIRIARAGLDEARALWPRVADDDEDAITAEDEDRAFLGFSDEDDDE